MDPDNIKAKEEGIKGKSWTDVKGKPCAFCGRDAEFACDAIASDLAPSCGKKVCTSHYLKCDNVPIGGRYHHKVKYYDFCH